MRVGLWRCCAPIGGAVETLWASNSVWVRVIVLVSSFSSQPDSEWTGRQLIIHYNYKTPIKPDIDCAIDPDQHVRRKEGKQKPRIILKQFIRLFTRFGFQKQNFFYFVCIHFPPLASQFVVTAAQEVAAQTQRSSQPLNAIFHPLF